MEHLKEAGAIVVGAAGLWLIYCAVTFNWLGWLGSIPDRIAEGFRVYGSSFGMGLVMLAMTAGGVVWLKRLMDTPDHNGILFFAVGLGVLSTGLTGCCFIFGGGLGLLLSPFGPAPDHSGLNAVRDQKAHGDAGTASARSVHDALHGGRNAAPQDFRD
jgi:hypothetical protein